MWVWVGGRVGVHCAFCECGCVVGPIWSARSPTFSQSGLRAGLLHLADGTSVLDFWTGEHWLTVEIATGGPFLAVCRVFT